MSLNDSPRQRPNDLSNRRRLDAIVTEYVERLNAGEELSPFEILAAYPDHGPEILKDLDAYASLERDNVPLGTLGDYTLRRQIGRGGMGGADPKTAEGSRTRNRNTFRAEGRR